MDKLYFYKIDKEYLDYLYKFDNKVPKHVIVGKAKPFCGVVIAINGLNYFAPISSYSKKEFTNIAIKELDKNTKKIKIISTIRFCYMIPAPDSVLTIINFKEQDDYYNNLIVKEYLFCQDHKEDIRIRANKIYNLPSGHQWHKQCCKFKELETGCKEYESIKQLEELQIAEGQAVGTKET